MRKLRIGVMYGGRSGEHEVSLASAAAVFANLDRSRYEPIPLLIDRDGRMTIPDKPPSVTSAAEVIAKRRAEGAHQARTTRDAHIIAHPGEETVLVVERRRPHTDASGSEVGQVATLGLDVVFPVLHGPYGEDGTVQGLLELAAVPYVGAGVLASSVGMDKAVMKTLFAARGLPIVDHLTVLAPEWRDQRAAAAARIAARLGFPVFVKPANLGSSVGISKARDAAELEQAMDVAAEFDRKIVIEAAVPEAREIECGVIGNDAPEASVPGEILPSREFYDYEAKYVEESPVEVPAHIPEPLAAEIRRLAIEAFCAIDGSGFARVDFLLSRADGRLYLNEINTIPGFTTISMFSKMWAASGVEYAALLDRLVQLALDRHAEKQRLRTAL